MSPHAPTAEARARALLTADLFAAIAAGGPPDDAAFARLFAAVRRYQDRFSQPPPPTAGPLPVEVFKFQPPATFRTRPAAAFLSSGTTRGGARRSRHPLATTVLYEAAVRQGFAQAVFGRNELDTAWSAAALQWRLLVPAAATWWRDRGSSLAHMGRTLWQSLASHTDAELLCMDPAAAPGVLRRMAARINADAATRVTLGFGTGFGWLHWTARLQALGLPVRLHPQSRILETGGYKGRGRELAPAELHATVAAATGLAPDRVFAEYGMTELCSQAYQVFDRQDLPRPDLPVYRPAPTLRVRAVDPAGAPCPPGQPGLLEVRDLMNLTSAAWLLLGDIGWVLPPAPPAAASFLPPAPFTRCDFQVLGRAARLAQRGCGLAADLQWLGIPRSRPPARPRPAR